MTDPVPSKDIVCELRATNNRPDFAQIYLRHLAQRAAAEIERLRTALRGIQSCSTCEACRGAATLVLGGAEPEAYYGALNRLSIAMGNPALHWKDPETIESALIDEAVRRLGKPAHEREAPHCSSCSCGMSVHAPLTDAEIDAIANEGYRNAAGGIYATSVYEFARAIESRAAQPPGDGQQ